MGKRKADETAEERRIRKAAKKDSITKSSSRQQSEEADKLRKATKKARNAAEKAKQQSTNEQNSQSKIGYSENRSDDGLSKQASAAAEEYLNKHAIEVTVSDNQRLAPVTRFTDLHLHEDIRAALSVFKEPSPIQASSWPYLLAGKDVVGIAETGSGKTFAFGVPALQYILNLPKKHGIHVLVVAPTRELAIQTADNLNLLGKASRLKAVCIYGGVSKDAQRTELKKANIVVGTPGRINDMLNDGSLDFSNVGYLVLDEADRMLDKGFEEDIKKIIHATPDKMKGQQRQTLMFSATWPEIVRKLAATFMSDPVKITIGSLELSANVRVTQKVEVLSEQRDKEYRLQQIIKQYQSGKNKHDRILIFALYKKEAARVESTLKYKGHNVAAIHGDMTQVQREHALAQFKSGECPLLVATDVAARGLDIPNVTLVVNLTFPLTIEDYVHRIGRTGRGGLSGVAITFFTKEDKAHSGTLINVLKQAKQEVPEELMKFGTTTKPKLDVYGRRLDEDREPMKAATKITFD